MEEEDLGLTGEVGHVISDIKWKKFYKHPLNYKTQWVNEFYAKSTPTKQKLNLL